MTTIVGAFTWSDPSTAAGLAQRLARETCGVPNLTPRRVIQTPHSTIYTIERPGSASRVDAWRGPDGSSCLFAGRLVGGGEPPRDLFRPALEDGAGQAVDADGCWLALAERPEGTALRLLSDPLGVSWLYLARWKNGYLFSGDYGALLRSLPNAPGLDEETALVTLALSYAPGAKTCARGVEMLPPGTLIEISRGEPRTLSALSQPYGDRHAGLPEEKKLEMLEEVMDTGIRSWCQDAAQPLVLSLSGGSDSRFALAHLIDKERPPRCATFGHPRSADVLAARATARRAGLETQIFYHRDATSWPAWKRSIAQIGTTGGFQWSGWADEWLGFVRGLGGSVLLGYLGDTYSGKNLADLPGRRDAWFENWVAWSLDEGWSGSPFLTSETQRRMEGAARERFQEIVDGLTVAYPHQLQVHLGLAGRLRRHVAAQPNLMARFVDPVLFFYTGAQRRFWTNLPYDDLRDQRLYLDYASRRFPRLFPPRRGPSILERAVGVTRNLLIARAPSLRPWIAPMEIDTARHVTENRNRILALFDEVAPLVGHWFHLPELRRALEVFPASRGLTSVQALRLVNLSLVLRAGAEPGTAPPAAAVEA